MRSNDDSLNRRETLSRLGAAGVAGLAGGLAGCIGGGDGDGDDGGGGGGGLNSIHVGLADPFSGVYAALGSAEQQGAELALEDLEEEFDVDIELTTADTEVNPDTGVQRAQQLVTEDGIDVLMGGVSSSVAIAMGQWATRNEVAFIAAGSHSDATTGGDCAKYMWRTPSSNTMLARTAGSAMAKYADSYAVMYADYTWGQTGRDAVVSVLEENGVDVVDTVSVPLGADDYTSALNRIEDSGAEAMANVTAGADTTRSCQQYLDSGIADDVKMSGVLLEDENLFALGQEGVAQMGVWGTVWGPGIVEGRTGEFNDRVASTYDRTAFSRHYTGYTSMDQLVRAAIRAGSTRAEDIRTELEGHDYTEEGLLEGTQAWRACDHQNLKPTYAVRAKDAGEMEDDDPRQWFEQVNKAQADEVARSCDETGCGFE
jgi:ABC-type branched-subunit amino acid transport system substrate-binding protein